MYAHRGESEAEKIRKIWKYEKQNRVMAFETEDSLRDKDRLINPMRPNYQSSFLPEIQLISRLDNASWPSPVTDLVCPNRVIPTSHIA